MKKCPFCAEEIQDQAIKCRFCGEFLDQRYSPKNQKSDLPWYFSTNIIVLAFMFVGPFALPLVILHPKYKPITKIIVSAVIIALTIAMYIFTKSLYSNLTQQIRDLGIYDIR